MLIHFKELDPQAHLLHLEPYQRLIEQLGKDVSKVSLHEFNAWLESFDPRLHCEALPSSSKWALIYEDQSVVPLCEWLVRQLRGRLIEVGRPPGNVAEALSAARHFGVDLSSSRVRVGFARGHLLDIYVSVPLDVPGSVEQLQVAAEVFLETLLGDRLLDDWVAQVAVDRIARARGLLVVGDVKTSAVNYPLLEVEHLVQVGIAALVGSLPASFLGTSVGREGWTALSLSDPSGDVPQPDRIFASTCQPEALKACLSGLPFCSARFTRGAELFAFLRFQGVGERQLARQQVEQQLESAFRDESELVLAGSGFGQKYDYLDFWVSPEPRVLGQLLGLVHHITTEFSLGFYDSRLAQERVDGWPGSAAIERAKQTQE